MSFESISYLNLVIHYDYDLICIRNGISDVGNSFSHIFLVLFSPLCSLKLIRPQRSAFSLIDMQFVAKHRHCQTNKLQHIDQ